MAVEEQQDSLARFGKGLGRFVDRFLCGRENHHLMYSCLGLGALKIGLPQENVPWSFPLAIINNRSFPQELSNPTINPLQAMGMEHPPIYETSISDALHLPDLNYNDAAHVLCITNGVYDTGKRFYELWEDPKLHHNVLSILTNKEFIGTGLPHAVSIAVMTLLHPLGALIAIPMGHFCGQLVGSVLHIMLGDKVNVSLSEHSLGAQHILSHATMQQSTTQSAFDEKSLKIEVLEPKSLKPFQENKVTLRMTHADGTPVPPEHLKDIHGTKMHAFIVNAGLSDGHHVHPMPEAEPGTYGLSFTPKTDRTYRLFVDCQHYNKEKSAIIYTDISSEKSLSATPSSIIQAKDTNVVSQKTAHTRHLQTA